MADDSGNNSPMITTTTTPSSNPWKKISQPHNIATAALSMDCVVDASSWPALSSLKMPSSEMACSTVSIACNSVCTEIAEPNGIVFVSVSAPIPEQTPTVKSTSSSPSSVPSSFGSGQTRNQFAGQNSNGYGQNHYQHNPPNQTVPNQRSNHYQQNPPNRTVPNQRNNGGFNSRGGGRRGGDGFFNQNFPNRRQQPPRGFHNWNNNRGGFHYIARPQHYHSVNRYWGPPPPPPPPPFPHYHPRSGSMLNPPYLPSPAPIPAPFVCYGPYGNTYFPEASFSWYYPPEAQSPVYWPPVPPPPAYLDAMNGKLSDNTPFLSNPEVTESWSVLPSPGIKEDWPILLDPEVTETSESELCGKILYQIEFYFCKNNLDRDTYLKNLMDDEGWVPIHLIANFPRIKNLTKDIKEMSEKINLVVKALQPSTVVQVQGDKMRRQGDWMNWVKNSSSVQMSLAICIQNIHLEQNAEVDAQ